MKNNDHDIDLSKLLAFNAISRENTRHSRNKTTLGVLLRVLFWSAVIAAIAATILMVIS